MQRIFQFLILAAPLALIVSGLGECLWGKLYPWSCARDDLPCTHSDFGEGFKFFICQVLLVAIIVANMIIAGIDIKNLHSSIVRVDPYVLYVSTCRKQG